MFENAWVYIDKEQLESLTGFKVGCGTGAYVGEFGSENGVGLERHYLTLNPNNDYVHQVFSVLEDGVSVFTSQSIVDRKWVDLNIMNAEMLDRLNPYNQRLEFPCNGGKLFAEFMGDRGIYDGVVVCYKRDIDGGEVQCALVETVSGTGVLDGDVDGQLFAHVWDYSDGTDDSTAKFTIDKETDMAVFPPEDLENLLA